MKKIILALVVGIGFIFSVNAQSTCKIDGAYGTVTATGIDLQVNSTGTPAKGVVNFTFSNSSEKKVNVTYSLSIAGVIVVANENVLVSPDGKDMQISYSINKYSQNLKREDVKIDITGADCKKE
jgi:phage-related protein